MTYLLIIAAICALTCLVLVARLILKDTKETPPTLPAEPYVFKHIEELIKSKTVGIPGTEGGHQRVDDFDEFPLDLTGLSTRSKNAIRAAKAFRISDLDMHTLGFYLKNTKGIGPKTLSEINAWSEANYGITIIN